MRDGCLGLEGLSGGLGEIIVHMNGTGFAEGKLPMAFIQGMNAFGGRANSFKGRILNVGGRVWVRIWGHGDIRSE